MCRWMIWEASCERDWTCMVERFAQQCRQSPEYQGDGWGYVLWRRTDDTGTWYRSERPIWEDGARGEIPAGRCLLVHARSAFGMETLGSGNNMPFGGGGRAFAFNGELSGVRLGVPGATGAHRIHHLLERMEGFERGPERVVDLLEARSRTIKAMNMVGTDWPRSFWVYSRYSERPEYFSLYQWQEEGFRGVASVPLLPGMEERVLPSGSLEVFHAFA